MFIKVLDIVDYVPGSMTAEGQLQNDGPDHTALISMADLSNPDIQANGGSLTIVYETLYIRAKAVNQDLINQIKTAEQNHGTGEAIVIIKDENIVTFQDALEFAQDMLQMLSQVQYALQFDTELNDFEPGQQFEYQDPSSGINNVLFNVLSTTEKWMGYDGTDDLFINTIEASTELISLKKLSFKAIVRAITKADRPPTKRFTQSHP